MNQEANTSEILNRDKKENTIKYQQDAEPVFDRKNIEVEFRNQMKKLLKNQKKLKRNSKQKH